MPQKIVLFMTVVCCLACAAEDEKFVNPLFYEIMDPISKIAWQTTLTPTKKIVDNGLGTTMEETCELTENTMERISLKCRGIINPDFGEEENTYRYTLRPCRKENGCYYHGRWLVEEETFDEKGYDLGGATLIIIK